MGRLKDKVISEMNVHEVRELVNNHKSSDDTGYIEFLEHQLEEAEKKIDKLKSNLREDKGPGYCVECFKPLSLDEIICNKCQDECDGRWDHLKETNNKKESQE